MKRRELLALGLVLELVLSALDGGRSARRTLAADAPSVRMRFGGADPLPLVALEVLAGP